MCQAPDAGSASCTDRHQPLPHPARRAEEDSSPETKNLPVGIREGQEAKLAGAVDDEILSHLAEVDHQQGGSREEFHCREGRKSGGEKVLGQPREP